MARLLLRASYFCVNRKYEGGRRNLGWARLVFQAVCSGKRQAGFPLPISDLLVLFAKALCSKLPINKLHEIAVFGPCLAAKS